MHVDDIVLCFTAICVPDTTTSETATCFDELGSTQGMGKWFGIHFHFVSYSIAVSVSVVVACSVVVFIVGVLGGFAGGTLIGYCCRGKIHSRKPHPPPPAAPLYDDITVTTTPWTRLELKENVAYGHVTMK